MKKYILLGLLLLVVLGGWQPAAAALGEPEHVEAFFDGMLAVQLQNYPSAGAVVAVVSGDEVVFSKGYGYSDVDLGRAATADETLFRVGSVTKLFVWTAVMQLVEQGLIDLTADINTYLDFTIPDTLYGGQEPVPDSPITMLHLMNHTAGFEDVLEGLFVRDAVEAAPIREYLRKYLPARVFPPGEIGAYSNYGSVLAAYVVEQVSGLAFADYVEQHIFAPLGMDHSTLQQPVPQPLADKVAQGWAYVDGGYRAAPFEIIQGYPAGSLSTTAADMAAFMRAHLNEGQFGEEQLLTPETAAQMQEQSFTHDAQLPGMAHGFMESIINGQRILDHGGDTFIFHAGMYLLPDEDVGLFVAYNSRETGPARYELLQAFLDQYYPAERPILAPVEAERLRPYVGTYHSARRSLTRPERLLSLFSTIEVELAPAGYLRFHYGDDVRQFVEIAPGVLQQRDGSERYVAERDASGRVTYLFPAAPFTLKRAAWFDQLGWTVFVSVTTAAIGLLSLVIWLAGLFLPPPRRRRPSLGGVLARLAGAAYCLLQLVFLVLLVRKLLNVDPLFGVPVTALETPLFGTSVLALALLLVLLTGLMLLFTLVAWLKSYWRYGGRLHYTVLTAAAAVFAWQLWLLNFW